LMHIVCLLFTVIVFSWIRHATLCAALVPIPTLLADWTHNVLAWLPFQTFCTPMRHMYNAFYARGVLLHVELLCLVNAMRWESVYNLEADDVETWFLSIALRWACLFLLWDVRSKRATPSLNKPLPRHQLWVWSGSPGASLRVHWF